MSTPRVTVILATFNRPRLALRALAALGSQRRPPDEVLVIDDGSTTDLRAVAEEVRRRGWAFIRQANQGLSGARNTGAAAASGDWLAFLDDDDLVEETWLEELAALVRPGVGLASCGAKYVTPDGELMYTIEPKPMGPAYDGLEANMLAGCFIVRRDLFDAAGAYAPGLRCSHQTELALRLVTTLAGLGLGTASTPKPLIRLERRAPTDRPMSSPEALLLGSLYVLERHADRLARDPAHLAGFHAVAGTSAARLEQWRLARTHLLAAARAGGGSRAWLRLGVAFLPPLARRVWRGAEFAAPTAGGTPSIRPHGS